jgi:hypothetical protein
MEKISMPWYPKDWWTSDTFFTLTIPQRYIYLELLFMMWMSADSRVKNDRVFIGRKLSAELPVQDWQAAVSRLVSDGDYLTSDNVKRRRRPDEARAENGAKGGRPKPGEKPSKEPSLKPSSKPGKEPKITGLLEQKENITEYNTSLSKKERSISTSNGSKPPNGSPSPLWALGTTVGSVGPGETWKKYGEHLQKILPDLDRDRMAKAWRNYWPYSIGPDQSATVDELIAQSDEKKLRYCLDEIGELLRLGEADAFLDPVDFAIQYLAP